MNDVNRYCTPIWFMGRDGRMWFWSWERSRWEVWR